MNEFSDLEAELKQLRPRAASADLATRVETALACEANTTPTAGLLPRPRKVAASWWAIGLGLGAAAAFVALAVVNVQRAPRNQRTTVATNSATPLPATRTQPENSFVPDGLTRVVYNRRDEGLVYPTSSAQPVRRVRSRGHETLQWTEPGTGASLRVSYPTDEVELIPVSGQ
jgi:negative regulator of sigma E activity